MRAQDAKLVPCGDILSQNGCFCVKTRINSQGETEHIYHSPFRQDKNPSFVVTPSRNIYIDFGLYVPGDRSSQTDPTICGNAIDLMSAFCGYAKGDLKKTLSEFSRRGYASKVTRSTVQDSAQLKAHSTKKIATGQKKEKIGASLELVEKKPLYSYVLKKYLHDIRKINLDIAMLYVSEIRYKKPHTENVYFAIGFPAGDGYEVTSGGTQGRNGFKSFVGTKKDITIFDQGTSKCFVFTGFIDFLSYLTYKNFKEPEFTTIVLNSDNLTHLGIRWLESQEGINAIYYFRDRDEIKPLEAGQKPNLSGLKSFEQFTEKLPSRLVVDVSEKRYPHFVDFNDFLTQKLPV